MRQIFDFWVILGDSEEVMYNWHKVSEAVSRNGDNTSSPGE
jgi:hypothetical protein